MLGGQETAQPGSQAGAWAAQCLPAASSCRSVDVEAAASADVAGSPWGGASLMAGGAAWLTSAAPNKWQVAVADCAGSNKLKFASGAKRTCARARPAAAGA
jgi:hypothetical protein